MHTRNALLSHVGPEGAAELEKPGLASSSLLPASVTLQATNAHSHIVAPRPVGSHMKVRVLFVSPIRVFKVYNSMVWNLRGRRPGWVILRDPVARAPRSLCESQLWTNGPNVPFVVRILFALITGTLSVYAPGMSLQFCQFKQLKLLFPSALSLLATFSLQTPATHREVSEMATGILLV